MLSHETNIVSVESHQQSTENLTNLWRKQTAPIPMS